MSDEHDNNLEFITQAYVEGVRHTCTQLGLQIPQKYKGDDTNPFDWGSSWPEYLAGCIYGLVLYIQAQHTAKSFPNRTEAISMLRRLRDDYRGRAFPADDEVFLAIKDLYLIASAGAIKNGL